jgi:hypothetical protein
LVIVLSFLLRNTDSDYPLGIFKFFLANEIKLAHVLHSIWPHGLGSHYSISSRNIFVPFSMTRSGLPTPFCRDVFYVLKGFRWELFDVDGIVEKYGFWLPPWYLQIFLSKQNKTCACSPLNMTTQVNDNKDMKNKTAGWLTFGGLTPLSTIFQLYHGDQF